MDSVTRRSKPTNSDRAELFALLAFYEGLIDGPQLRKAMRRWLSDEMRTDLIQFMSDLNWVSASDSELLRERVDELLLLRASSESFGGTEDAARLKDQAPNLGFEDDRPSVFSPLVGDTNGFETEQEREEPKSQSSKRRSRRSRQQEQAGEQPPHQRFDYYDAVHERFMRGDTLSDQVGFFVSSARRNAMGGIRRMGSSSMAVLDHLRFAFHRSWKRSLVIVAGTAVFLLVLFQLNWLTNKKASKRGIAKTTLASTDGATTVLGSVNAETQIAQDEQVAQDDQIAQVVQVENPAKEEVEETYSSADSGSAEVTGESVPVDSDANFATAQIEGPVPIQDKLAPASIEKFIDAQYAKLGTESNAEDRTSEVSQDVVLTDESSIAEDSALNEEEFAESSISGNADPKALALDPTELEPNEGRVADPEFVERKPIGPPTVLAASASEVRIVPESDALQEAAMGGDEIAIEELLIGQVLQLAKTRNYERALEELTSRSTEYGLKSRRVAFTHIALALMLRDYTEAGKKLAAPNLLSVGDPTWEFLLAAWVVNAPIEAQQAILNEFKSTLRVKDPRSYNRFRAWLLARSGNAEEAIAELEDGSQPLEIGDAFSCAIAHHRLSGESLLHVREAKRFFHYTEALMSKAQDHTLALADADAAPMRIAGTILAKAVSSFETTLFDKPQ